MEENSRLIVSAYAVHPLPGLAEGIVNAAWLDALRRRVKIGLVTSPAGYHPLRSIHPEREHEVLVYADDRRADSRTILERLADWTTYPQHHPAGAVARLFDYVRQTGGGLPPVSMTAWSRRAATQILSWLESEFKGAVVWARATPPGSFQAVIEALQKRAFPLVVNYNDPLPRCVLWGKKYSAASMVQDRLEHEQNRVLAVKAQAWTFPSRRLADLMVDVAGLDPQRCFVLPHLVPQDESSGREALMDGPWLIYAGTFYPSAFSEAMRDGLVRYARSGGRLKFMFTLKRPTVETLCWIKRELPAARVHVDVNPVEVSAQLQRAQAVMVVDTSGFRPLLMTKVIQAANSGRPTIAFTQPDSTTGDVIKASGGIVVNPANAEQVERGLYQLERMAEDGGGLKGLKQVGRPGLSRLSAEQVASDSLSVMDYAQRRFAWRERQSGPEPEPPQIERWP